MKKFSKLMLVGLMIPALAGSGTANASFGNSACVARYLDIAFRVGAFYSLQKLICNLEMPTQNLGDYVMNFDYVVNFAIATVFLYRLYAETEKPVQ